MYFSVMRSINRDKKYNKKTTLLVTNQKESIKKKTNSPIHSLTVFNCANHVSVWR